MADLAQARLALDQVEARVRVACESAGRRREEVTLVAVSKTRPIQAIQALYDLGVRDFGESRLQESDTKITALPEYITWHFIGAVQSNKAKKIASLVSVIHAIDSDSQLREIEKQPRVVDILIQVNLAEESQKAGIFAGGLDELLSRVLNYRQVRFRGLMTIGPATYDSEQTRQLFRKLAELNRQVGGSWLSIGMSGDFEVALQEGATHIRVGSALFGDR